VWVVHGGTVTEATFDPASLGIARATAEDLRGGDAAHNAAVVRSFLGGDTGPVRDAVLLNAAAAVAAFRGEEGSLEERLKAGLESATEALDSGSASAVLDRWVEVSQRLRPAPDQT
jgi:anthranilate phosphoribosyltransferase